MEPDYATIEDVLALGEKENALHQAMLDSKSKSERHPGKANVTIAKYALLLCLSISSLLLCLNMS